MCHCIAVYIRRILKTVYSRAGVTVYSVVLPRRRLEREIVLKRINSLAIYPVYGDVYEDDYTYVYYT